MTLSQEQLDKAIYAKIAEQVLGTLDEETRNEIVARAVAKQLEEFGHKYRLADVIADRACEVAAYLLRTEPWNEKVMGAVWDGLSGYIAKLRKAIEGAMIEAIHGNDGSSYTNGPGLILKHLRKES